MFPYMLTTGVFMCGNAPMHAHTLYLYPCTLKVQKCYILANAMRCILHGFCVYIHMCDVGCVIHMCTVFLQHCSGPSLVGLLRARPTSEHS